MPRIAVAAISLALFSALPAGAATPTSVDSLGATVGASTVAISGTATFRDIPVETGIDGAGDASAPGTDLTKASISMPTTTRLRFRLDMADPLPQISSNPFAVYLWPITVDGENTGLNLHASRLRPGSADPHLRVVRITGGQITTVATVTGAMANGAIEWDVTLASINATPGSEITSEGAITVVPGASGVGTVNGNNLDDMFADATYVVPSRKVLVGVGPTGSAIDPQTPANVASNGSFTVAVPRPAAAGSYDVRAVACFGPQSCGTAGSTFSV